MVYIAMLRGINVSGHKPVKMELLRAAFESLGFSDVKTYVQSGNVVFHAAKASPSALAEKITKQILADFGFAVPVQIRTSTALGEVLKRNPFAKQAGIDETRLHVTFLSGPAPRSAVELLKPLAVPSEKIHVEGREVYLYCPDGYGITKLSNTAIEKKLAVQATTRNWRTVNSLHELSGT